MKFYRDNTGRERVFKTENIIERKELHTSMMPEGLVDTLTDRELREPDRFHERSTKAADVESQ